MCNDCFANKRLCRQHILKHLKSESGESREEEKTKKEKKHVCSVCNVKFLSLNLLNQHENIHKGVKPFKCDVCDKSYPLKLSLERHKLLKHNCKPKVSENSFDDFGDGFQEEEKTKREKKHVCSICNVKCLSLNLLNQHQNIHKGERPFKCDMCDKSYPLKLSLRKHKVIKHNPNYKAKGPSKHLQCEECGKQFSYTHSLKIHLITHTGQKSYVCYHCGKSLTSRQTLYEHVNGIHSGNKPYACDECDKFFVTPKILRLHKKIHSKVRPYVCEVCGKGFTQRTAHLVHMRYHLGLKPFVCTFCNKGFASVSIMKRHIRLSHDESKKKVIRCSQCPETFYSKLLLKKHEKVHWPSVYSCEQCQKTFDLRSKYKRHMRGHKCKIDLPCTHCGKILSSKYSLKRHMKTHTVENLKKITPVMTFPQ